MFGEVVAATAFELSASTILPLTARDTGGASRSLDQNQSPSIVQLLSSQTFVNYGFEDNSEALRLYEYISTTASVSTDDISPRLTASLAKRKRQTSASKSNAVMLQILEDVNDYATIEFSGDDVLTLHAVFKTSNMSESQPMYLNGTEPVELFIAVPQKNTIKGLKSFRAFLSPNAAIHERVDGMMRQLSHYTTTILPGMVDRVGPAAFRNAVAQVAVEMYQEKSIMAAVKR